ncbi:hypothetical protein ACHAP5_011570 [Fusarium lateritium]
MSKLIVKGLAWSTTQNSLRRKFREFGEVKEAIIVRGKDTGRSKCIATVTFSDASDAQVAQEQMDGQDFEGCIISVHIAENSPPKRLV